MATTEGPKGRLFCWLGLGLAVACGNGAAGAADGGPAGDVTGDRAHVGAEDTPLDSSLKDASLTRDASAEAEPLPDPGPSCEANELGGCGESGSSYANWPDPLGQLPWGEKPTQQVCERRVDDLVHRALCGFDRPRITNLTDLLATFSLRPNDLDGFTSFSLAGHSTALSARSVSAINPRVVFVRVERTDWVESRMDPGRNGQEGDADAGVYINGLDPQSQMLLLAFVRGEQFVEIIVRDNDDDSFRFYVVGFRQACNYKRDGCTPGDLLTPAIESEWIEYTLYDETALENTVMDCAPCHQPNGPGTPKVLRMHELNSPWTHWFSNGSEGGMALFADYLGAKGSEPLAELSHESIRDANPNSISIAIFFSGLEAQPFEFVSDTIEAEVKASAAAMGGMQPMDNAVPGQSPTWLELYRAAQRGETITVPYHDVKVTDPKKLAAMSAAYQAYRRGDLARSALPDIRDVFPDDPERLAHMGMMTEPGLSGEGVLMEACASCHNAHLNQNLSRARFAADLTGMGREEKDRAIERLMLPPSHPLAMPPARLRMLTPEARARAIKALKK